jgi:type IV pilus assembly protein PilB
MKKSINQKQPVKSDSQDEAVIKLVSEILLDAFENSVSDIHFEWVAGKLRVRLRADGVLRESVIKIPPEMQNQVITRLKIMAGLNEKENRLPQDGRVRMNIKGKDYDLRVSTVPYVTGEAVVLRVLSRQAVVLKLEKAMPDQDKMSRLRRWMNKPGLIIASGPTGSGKTTLLYCMLNELNTPGVKITTVEDPVEYLIEGVNQQQVNVNAGVTFPRALRAQLRQDPDIIMVNEIRDLETVHIIIQAALTGHLVLSSLHTNDAPGIITRLLDMGLEPFLLSNTLIGGIAQRLVRAVCQNCKEEYRPEPCVMEQLGPHTPKQFLHGRGCDKCHKTGFRGRIALYEMLEMDDDLRKLVAKNAGAAELRSQALKSGMISLKADGLAKAVRGITTVEEVLRVCAV